MRTLSDQESRIYAQTNRHVQLRVRVADAGATLQDIDGVAGGPWLLGAEWGEDVGQEGAGEAPGGIAKHFQGFLTAPVLNLTVMTDDPEALVAGIERLARRKAFQKTGNSMALHAPFATGRR